MKTLFGIILTALFSTLTVNAQDNFEKDIIKTSSGDLEITFIGHGSLMMKYGGKIIHIDPYSKLADYDKLPKADLILITHEHPDHLDPIALQKIRTTNTVLVLTKICAETDYITRMMKNVEAVPANVSSLPATHLISTIILKNGDTQKVMGIKVEAVPAYNLVGKRDNGQPWHSKGDGNGYVLNFDDKRVYVAGDTENTPEMKALKNINYAFLPMNQPYTMTPEMVADAVKAFKPKVLYPYHFSNTDTSKIAELLKDTPETEVRMRKMK